MFSFLCPFALSREFLKFQLVATQRVGLHCKQLVGREKRFRFWRFLSNGRGWKLWVTISNSHLRLIEDGRRRVDFQLGDGMSEALRVLLGDYRLHAEDARRVDETLRRGDDLGEVLDVISTTKK